MAPTTAAVMAGRKRKRNARLIEDGPFDDADGSADDYDGLILPSKVIPRLKYLFVKNASVM